jgi:hypothetical protein
MNTRASTQRSAEPNLPEVKNRNNKDLDPAVDPVAYAAELANKLESTRQTNLLMGGIFTVFGTAGLFRVPLHRCLQEQERSELKRCKHQSLKD